MENPKYKGQLTTAQTNTIITLIGTSPYDILEELEHRANIITVEPTDLIFVKLTDIETKNILVKREYTHSIGGGITLTFQYLDSEFKYIKPQTWREENEKQYF